MVDVSQRIAVTGMLANQRQLDVVANNLANANTTGFKKAVAHTTDIGYQAGLTAPVGPGGAAVRLQGIGEGTQLADISHQFLPGALQATGNPLDIALQGDGFFSVTMADGTTGYSRDGSFTVDGSGRLVTSGGHPLQSDAGTDLTVPPGSVDVRFDDTGQLTATAADGTTQVAGRLALSTFPNNQGLQAMGENIYTATAASGAAVNYAAG